MPAVLQQATVVPVGGSTRTATSYPVVPAGVVLYVTSFTWSWTGQTPSANLTDAELGTVTAAVTNAVPTGFVNLDSIDIDEQAGGQFTIVYNPPVPIGPGLFPCVSSFASAALTRIDSTLRGYTK